ncbi:MAG: radical SAM domain-containing protein [Candidatus Magnetoglobus multicellularis str. Araruama]|uniref:Radical SAM domain-containing protein n=1 Tax=Candidatus Magnetoglobus multicellularis str. Araruama TaxID=890399 RepID=A0A1V1NZT7_9BACT|nr:MAG: radical SAM domain-containing protein [Candidatus Magnetoglobus multicellularis str. Araruama]
MYRPKNIYYMNTIECNQKCTKCSHWKYKDEAERLPTEKFINGIKSIPTTKELCIVGGEPLLFKSEIYKILQGVAEINIRTVIITNGVSMDKDFIYTVSKYNIHIVVSIDTMDRGFWKFVRGTDSHGKVLKNFEYATNILTSAQISIQSVLSKETQPHIAGVAEYAKSKNVYHSIQDYIQEGFEGSWTATEDKQVVIPSNVQQCFAADRNLSIIQNGDVYTCFQQTWIDGCQKPIGNLNIQTMPEILSSEYAISVSKKMRICNLPCKVLKCNTKD